jgi:hypothetical protein
MVSSIPLPEGLPLAAASWEQTPLVVRQLVVQLLAVTQQQTEQMHTLEARIATLEACLHQRSNNSDRPPSANHPYEKRPARSGGQGSPGLAPRGPAFQTSSERSRSASTLTAQRDSIHVNTSFTPVRNAASSPRGMGKGTHGELGTLDRCQARRSDQVG